MTQPPAGQPPNGPQMQAMQAAWLAQQQRLAAMAMRPAGDPSAQGAVGLPLAQQQQLLQQQMAQQQLLHQQQLLARGDPRIAQQLMMRPGGMPMQVPGSAIRPVMTNPYMQAAGGRPVFPAGFRPPGAQTSNPRPRIAQVSLMSNGRPLAPQMPANPAALQQAQLYQQLLANQQRSLPGQVGARHSIPGKRPAPMLPYVNRYIARLKQEGGGSALLLSTTVFKRKKMAEDDSDQDEESEYSDSSAEDGSSRLRRRTSQTASTAQQGASSSQKEEKLPPPSGLIGPITERPQIVKRALRRTKHTYLSKADMRRLADVPELLIPIRIDIELEGFKLEDVFMWNYHESLLLPEKFAELMCEDLDLPPQTFVRRIADAIRQQVDDFSNIKEIFNIPSEDDTRVPIQLDLQVGRTHLVDRFEWDLASTLTPEAFSAVLVSDLGLGGEFSTIITHSIYEQLVRHRLNLYDPSAAATYSFGGDDPFGPTRLDSLRTALRPIGSENDWGPYIEKLTDEDLERIITGRERSARRMRREQRGSGRLSRRRAARY